MWRPTSRFARRSVVLTILVLVVARVPLPGWAEAEDEDKSPLSVGGYHLSGAASVGYRFVEIDSGREALYDEVINLDDGVRLLDFSLHGQRATSEPALVDRFSLDAMRIGDPFPRIRFEVAKDDAYALKVTFRESELFVDRTDDARSGNRDFDIRRRFGDATLTLFPTDFLTVHLFYHHTERDGSGRVPRRLEGNVFGLRQSPAETTNVFGVAADLTTPIGDLHFEQAYRRFDDDGEVTLPMPGLHGLRTDTPFATQRLDTFREAHDNDVETLITRLRLRSTVTERWEITAGYVFAYTTSSSALHTTASGVGRAGTSGPNEDFTTELTGSGETESALHIVDLGTSYALRPNLIWHLDHRFHRVDQETTGTLRRQRTGALTGTVTPTPEAGSQAITINASTLSTFLEYVPWPSLVLRAGYRYQLRDVNVDQTANGLPVLDDPLAAAPRLDRVTHSHGAILSADWRYRDLLRASVKYTGDYFDNPYTRISPTEDNRLRLRVRFSPVAWLTASETFTIADLDHPDTGTSTRRLATTTGLFLQPREWLTLEGSVTYEDLDHRSRTLIPINAVRTLTEFPNDSQAISYMVAGSLNLWDTFQAKAHASWTRVFGEGSLSAFFPSLELSYLWKQFDVRLTARYERPYVIERDPPEDQFFAHVVTLFVTKEF